MAEERQTRYKATAVEIIYWGIIWQAEQTRREASIIRKHGAIVAVNDAAVSAQKH